MDLQGVISSDSHDRLQAFLNSPTPAPVIALVGIAPLLIAYLAHFPETKPLRLGAWLVGVTAWAWCAFTIDIHPINSLRVICYGLFGFGAHYTITGAVVQYHTLPRTPPLAFLRRFSPVKAVLLLIDGHRQITVKGFGPPLQRRYASNGLALYIRAIARHLAYFLLGMITFDLMSYIPYRLAPNTFGSIDQVGGDAQAWYRDLSATYGVPVLAVRLFWSVLFLIISHAGFVMQCNLLAAVCLCTGLYIPEEWPDFSDWPVLATSLNEFWGKRWHVYMRDFYLIAARPFVRFGRAIHILAIFGISAAVHVAMYYPRKHQLVVGPYAVFYFGNALACLAERAYKQQTGKKVDGTVGRIWTWTVLFIIAQPSMDVEIGSGWLGRMRHTFAYQPEYSVVVWVMWALGRGPSPGEIHAERAMRG